MIILDQLPFEEEWLTFWGGDNEELNAYHNTEPQKYAFDFVIVDKNGSFHKNEGKKNSDYYSFSQKVVSPISGTVVEVVDGVNDNPLGTINNYSIFGNYVIIKASKEVYLIICHFEKGTLAVKDGDELKPGQLLGLCGNSGHSTSAHIHMHAQDSLIFKELDKNFTQTIKARSIKIGFRNVAARSLESEEYLVKENYSPIKGDLLLPKIG